MRSGGASSQLVLAGTGRASRCSIVLASTTRWRAGVSANALVADQVLKGGFLTTVKTGGGNDLFQSPGNAGEIIRAAINQVASLRGFLGAVVADSIEPNIRSVSVEIENLSASLSTIRDLDFAEETAAFIRNQVLVQSSLAVLANAAATPQAAVAAASTASQVATTSQRSVTARPPPRPPPRGRAAAPGPWWR